jgi:hypothetical protein
MAFESVVRPMVLPNIRPAPARVLPPQDDVQKGVCVITGGGGGLIDLPFSFNMSFTSEAAAQEVKRRYDVERVYQVTEDKDGKKTINKDNYVDIERMTAIKVIRADGSLKTIFVDPPLLDNVEVLRRALIRSGQAE